MDLIATLIPSFGNVAFTVIAFIVALSIIVAVHEYGHYIVGRWTGIHAEVFSIGFGKVLYSRTDKRGTVWQVAALPFGGFVKFLGDANAASVGSEAGASQQELDSYIAEKVQPAGQAHTAKLTHRNTMLGAPLWARSLTVAAGPAFNFIMSFLVFAAILLVQGQPKTPLTVGAIPAFPEEYNVQLLPQDQVVRVEGITLNYPDGVRAALAQVPSQPFVTYDVIRDGVRMSVTGPQPLPALVQSITPRSPADRARVRVGDVILSMNATPVYSFNDMIAYVDSNGAQAITLEIWRDGVVRTEQITPQLVALPQEDGGMRDEFKLGIGNGGLFFEPETTSFGVFEALWLGAQQVWYIIKQSLYGMWSMISGVISTCNMSGPVGIAETSGSMASQGVMSFISFIAVLSTAVGLLNLFPIPVLDGGHLVFHAYEAVTGKMPTDNALRLLMAVGLAMIGTLMLFAIANDLFLCP